MERGNDLLVAAAVLIAGLIIGGVLWDRSEAAPAPKVGSVQAVTLVGGQVYFGRVERVTRASIVLTDLVEAQNVVNADKRSVQLLNRSKGAWHQPRDMEIPKSNILFTETVSADSQVGKSVFEGRAVQPRPN